MLQLQYYNKGLSKTQIEQIIKNYNLKYTTLTNEINLKLNSIIKTVLNDITPFLENIEYLSKQAKQLKEFENAKSRIDMLEDELLLKAEEYKKNAHNPQNTNKINNKAKNRQKSLDLNKAKTFRNSSLDKLEISKEIKTSRNEEENTNINNSINTSTKKQKQKINFKWSKDNNNKYMMNLKEITRNLAGYHEKVVSTKTTQNIIKFISGSNYKEERKSTKKDRKSVV